MDNNQQFNNQQNNGQQQNNAQPQFNNQQPQQPQQPQWNAQPQQPQWNAQPQQPQWNAQPQQPQWNAQPQQPQYNNQPYYGQAPQGPKMPDGKACSVTALVLGICSAAFSMIMAWSFPISLLFLACGIVGIILAIVGRKKSTACYGRPSGVATAGFVLSIIGTAISALFILSCLACAACVGAELGSLSAFL